MSTWLYRKRRFFFRFLKSVACKFSLLFVTFHQRARYFITQLIIFCINNYSHSCLLKPCMHSVSQHMSIMTGTFPFGTRLAQNPSSHFPTLPEHQPPEAPLWNWMVPVWGNKCFFLLATWATGHWFLMWLGFLTGEVILSLSSFFCCAHKAC